MAFNFGQWLPHLIMGGATVAGSVIGARASGKAAETSAQASEAAAETQLTMSREQLAQLREIYGIDLSLNWPRHRVATESLGNLARGMGSKLPSSAFETTDAPPELPGPGGPGGAPGTGGGPGSDPLDPNSPAYNPIQTPPGRGPSATGTAANRALTGAGAGATIGSVVPGVGTAAGAAAGAMWGAVSSLWGRGRREADHIVPSQEELTRRIGIVGGELGRRIGDGTAIEQDWNDAAQIVRDLRDQYYEFSDEYKRAGPGARTTMDGWLNPMLDAWDKRALNWAEDWTTWEYDPNAVWSAPPEGTGGEPPSRRFGGPVGGTLSTMAKKPEYLVGEVGPEMYVDEQGNSSMVGMGGPQMFAPPRDGYIVPNHDLGQRGAITLSDLGNGTYGMPPKQRMLGGPGRGRYMGSRHAGGSVIGPGGQPAPEGYHWHDGVLISDEATPPPTPPAPPPAPPLDPVDPARPVDPDRPTPAPPPPPAPPPAPPLDPVDPARPVDPDRPTPAPPPPPATPPADGLKPGYEWYRTPFGIVQRPIDPNRATTDPNNSPFSTTPEKRARRAALYDTSTTPEEDPGEGHHWVLVNTGLKPDGTMGQRWAKRPQSETGDQADTTSGTGTDTDTGTGATRPQDGEEYLTGRGWRKRPDGSYWHPGEGGRGHEGVWIDDNTFYVKDAVDPETGEVTGAYFKLDVSLAAGDANQDWLTNAGNAIYGRPSGHISSGEFRDPNPNQGQFSSGPAPDPFSYAPGEHGYQPLNEEFSFTTQEYQVPPGMRKELKAWGWEELPDGTWLHDDGYEARLVGDKLVSDEQDVVFDISDYMDTAGDPNRFEDVSKFQTEGVPDALKGLRPHAGYQALNKKFEFDTEDLLKDPGYQFRQDEGAKAIERKGAARGMLQSGRTLQSLSNFSQGLASQEYGQAYGRSLGEFGIRERQTLNAYDRAEKEFGMRRGQSLDARDQAFKEWGAKYGMYGDAYNRDLQEYENERDEWRWGDERRWGRTLALAGQ